MTANPEQHSVWTDPATGMLYISYIDTEDGTIRFAIVDVPAAGLPTVIDTITTPPQTLVPLTPAWDAEPPVGVRHRLVFREDLDSYDAFAWFTGVREPNGQWCVDGSERWRYDTDELVIGAPTPNAAVTAAGGDA